MMKDTIKELKRENPGRGKWHILKGDEGIVWYDASSIAMAVILEFGGVRM